MGHGTGPARTQSPKRATISAEVIDAVAPRATLDLTVVTMGEEDDDVVSDVVAGDHAGFAFHTVTQLCHTTTLLPA